jgi:polysaccharide export outer membrane protein
MQGSLTLNSERKSYGPYRKAGIAQTLAVLLLTSGCSMVPTSGPSSRAISKLATSDIGDKRVEVVNVDDEVARRLVAHAQPRLFSDVLGDGSPVGTIIGRGDGLAVSIWEAPPAVLFGPGGGDPRATSSSSTARGTTLPEQMVDNDGRIVVPFVGALTVAGKSPKQVEQQIVTRLSGKAHQPQVLVQLTRNTNTTVTVVGDVANTTHVPLTPRGERLLDILASAGGTRQPVGKSTIQITRGTEIASLPLELVIRDPRQNIRLQAGDVVTALFQPYSFTALGATGRNEEVPFEATGLTLSQALGRVAGLQDARANAKGVFVFRFEDPAHLSAEQRSNVQLTPDGKAPIIYQIDLRDPRNMFVSQNFPMRDKDILYIANAPLADIQKFVNVIYSSILPAATAATVIP